MTNLTAASVLCVPFVLACSSASPTQPQQGAQPAPAVATEAATPIIEVKALTVRWNGMPIARLHADGRTESVGDTNPKEGKFSPGPTLHSDGTIELTKAGFKARVERDGDIFVVSPTGAGQPDQLYGRISGDQLWTSSSRDSGVRIERADLVMFHESKVTNVLGVFDPPDMGRTALVMTAAFFIDLAITSR